ncbi:MAG: hypothetical protein ACK5IP_21490 [Paracoccus sp. (in: a-proteobacteria)]
MADTACARADRIEIVCGVESGLRSRRNELAVLGIAMICPTRYLVVLIEDDGGQVVLWDGSSYEEAIFEAEWSADEWRVPVLDRVVE